MSRYAIIDKETGEIVVEDALFIGKKPQYVDRGFIKIFIAFLKDIVEDKDIAGKSIRLLFYMLEQLDYNTYTIRIIPKYAQEALGITKDTYYRWLNTLIEKGIIDKVDTYTYQLNPYVAVKGYSGKALNNDLDKAQEELKKLKKRKP